MHIMLKSISPTATILGQELTALKKKNPDTSSDEISNLIRITLVRSHIDKMIELTPILREIRH